MSGDARSYADRILCAIEFGRLSTTETERRLKNIIEAEISKTDVPADMELLEACQSLLWQLHTHGKIHYDSHSEQNHKRILSTVANLEKRSSTLKYIIKWTIAAAAILIVVLGCSGALHWNWFEQYSTPDNQQRVIVGHEITADMISSALAENQYVGNFGFTNTDDLQAVLGFSPNIPLTLPSGWSQVHCDLSLLGDEIAISVLYNNSAYPNCSMVYTVSYFSDINFAITVFEQSHTGTSKIINGTDVYFTTNTDHTVAAWVGTTSIHILSVDSSVPDLLINLDNFIGR